jgi:hypothetical protein
VSRCALAGAALLVALAGCSTAPAPRAADAPQPAGGEQPAPEWLTVPAAGVSSSLVPLGLTADGQQAVPPLEDQHQAGWFEGGPEPGEVGAAVIVGHVNGDGLPGVFANLTDVQAGDTVTVDGRTFTVYETATVPKHEFPRDEVYGPTDSPELRLITCGGVFDEAADSYAANVVVFARLA